MYELKDYFLLAGFIWTLRSFEIASSSGVFSALNSDWLWAFLSSFHYVSWLDKCHFLDLFQPLCFLSISVDVHVTADHTIKATLNTVPGKPLFCSNDYICRVIERWVISELFLAMQPVVCVASVAVLIVFEVNAEARAFSLYPTQETKASQPSCSQSYPFRTWRQWKRHH